MNYSVSLNSGTWSVGHSYARDEKIWQISSDIIKPKTGNGAERPLQWIKNVVDVVPRRDGPENLRILKKVD